MDLGIAGRTALVLGGGGGLGGAIALALAAEGVDVAIADRDEAAAQKRRAQIEELGVRSLAVGWDLADLGSARRHLDRIESELGTVDVLVNNTGGPAPGPVAGVEPGAWRDAFESMVLSVMHVTDLVLPGMRQRSWGRIITSASSGVVAPIDNLGVSNALRSSLVGWSKTLANEVGRDGITCNVIVPGRVATPRIEFLDEQRAAREGRDLDAVRAASVASIPLGRYGDPAEYGAVAAFLAGQPASFVTGSVVRVDGGMIAAV